MYQYRPQDLILRTVELCTLPQLLPQTGKADGASLWGWILWARMKESGCRESIPGVRHRYVQ